MQTYYTIYKTTNVCNGKFYIGKHKTLNLEDGYLGSGVVLGMAIKKYGKENFITEQLFCFDNPLPMEEKEIELVNSDLINDSNCYNIALGGQGGNTLSDPVVAKRHAIATSNALRGVTKTELHKLALSKSMLGRKQDPLVVERRAKTCKDNRAKMTQEERNARFGNTGEANGFYNKSHSLATILILKQKCGRKGALSASAKSITVDGVTYQTHKECMEQLGLSKRQLKKLKQSLGELTMNKIGETQ